MKEIWKNIKGYEGYYQISNLGRVKSLNRLVKSKSGSVQLKQSKVRKLRTDKDGYLRIYIWKEGKDKGFFIHRLIAQAFIPNPENKPCVNHKDGNKQNNNLDNLEWVTVSENNKHAIRIGLYKPNNPTLGKFGKSHHNHKVILQYDFKGNIIERFYGICEASRQTNIDRTTIGMVCNGRRKTAGGFIWRFA